MLSFLTNYLSEQKAAALWLTCEKLLAPAHDALVVRALAKQISAKVGERHSSSLQAYEASLGTRLKGHLECMLVDLLPPRSFNELLNVQLQDPPRFW